MAPDSASLWVQSLAPWLSCLAAGSAATARPMHNSAAGSARKGVHLRPSLVFLPKGVACVGWGICTSVQELPLSKSCRVQKHNCVWPKTALPGNSAGRWGHRREHEPPLPLACGFVCVLLGSSWQAMAVIQAISISGIRSYAPETEQVRRTGRERNVVQCHVLPLSAAHRPSGSTSL